MIVAEKRVTVWIQRFVDRPNLMLQWNDPETGRRKSQTAGTADEAIAEVARRDLEYELNHGLHRDVSRISWERFRELFEAEYVTPLREDTRINYGATLDLFEQICKPAALQSVTVRTISKFAAGMRALPGRAKSTKSMMPSTIKVRLQFLHTALSWAVSQKMIGGVPEFPTIKVSKKNPQPVPLEAVEKLLAKAGDDNQMRVYILCGWLAGLRLSEAHALEWEESESFPWVDFARDRIVLPAEFVKGDRDQWVPLDPKLREALESLPRQGNRVFCFIGAKGGSQGAILGEGGVSQRVSDLARKAGVRVTMKTLRRGFGCRYAGKVPAQVLQKLMRHANIKTTMEYYANVDDAVMDAVLGECNSPRNTDEKHIADSANTIDASLFDNSPNSPSANERPVR